MPASNNIKELLATAEIDFGADAFQIILMELGFVFDPDTHDEYADVAGNELPTLNGYTIGGETLAGVAVTRNDLDDRIDVTWNNVTWTAVGGPIGPAVGAIIYDDTVLNDPIVGYINFGAAYTQADGGTATITNISVRII